MKKLGLFLTALLALTVSAMAGPYGAWSSYKTITINTSSLNVQDVTGGFPFLVRLDNGSNATGADILSGSLTASGLDVVFTDSTGEIPLSFERERWSGTNAEFWVRIPVVNGSATNGGITKIRVYWGKSSASNLSSPAAVFDKTTGTGNGYQAVYHMTGTDSNEVNVTGGNTALNLVSKNAGFTGVSPQIAGAIGQGRSLNATSITTMSPTGFATPNKIHMASSTIGYAVGNAGAIRKTTDGGATWSTQTSNTAEDLKSVTCNTTARCIAVGANKAIVTTTDGGTTWTAVTTIGGTNKNISFNDVSFTLGSANVVSADRGFIVGDSGQVVSILTFSTSPAYAFTSLGAGNLAYRAIACDNNVCFVGGDAGAVRKLQAINGTAVGVAMNAVNAAVNFKSAAFIGQALAFSAVGDSAGVGAIWRPTLTNNTTATNNVNRYKTIEPFFTLPLPPLNAVAYGVPTANIGGGANASAAGWIVGNNGMLIRTLNSGNGWGVVTSGTSENLTTLGVPRGTTTTYAAYNGIAGGANNTLLNVSGSFGQYFASGILGATTSSTTATDSSVLNFKEVGPFSISAWVNPQYFDGAVHNITTKGDMAWVLQLDGATGTVASRWNVAVYGTVGGTTNPTNSYTNWFSGANGTASAAGLPIAQTGWHHIVGTKKSTNPALPASTEIYVNGVLSNNSVPGTNTNTSTNRTFNQLLTIGKTLDGGGTGASDRFWMGGVDEFRYSSSYHDSSYNRLSYESQKAGASLTTQSVVGIPAPSIATQPRDTIALSGAPLRLSVVAASASPISSYTWFKSATQLNAGGNISFSALGDTLKLATITAADTGFYRVVVTNAGGSITSDSAHVTAAIIPAVSGYTSPVIYTVGTAITANTPVLTGNPSSCTTVPALPSGLSINNSTCAITGTPLLAGRSAATNYKVHATNAAGTDSSQVINITVIVPAPTSITYGIQAATIIVGTPIATNTPVMVGVIDNVSVLPSLPAGLSLNATTGVITGTPTTPADSMEFVFTASNDQGSVKDTVFYRVRGSALSSLEYVPQTEDYFVGTPITNKTPNVVATTNPVVVDSFKVSPTLPAGLALDKTTGVISGTPSAPTAATAYTITAHNFAGNATFVLTLTVTGGAPSALTYSNQTVTYTGGVSIPTNLPTVTGGVSTWSVSPSLPSGLSLNTTTGAISGTPATGSSAADYTVTATNGFGSTTSTINITVTTPENYSVGWQSKTLTLNTSAAAAGVTTGHVLKVPVLVRLNSTHSTIFNAANANGSDIRFSKTDGTRLAFELETWDNSGQTAALWVLMDSVKADATTSFRIHYGNASATTSTSSGPSVFDRGNGFVAVWHMNEAVGAPLVDATGNNHTATPANSPTDLTTAIGTGKSFNGTNQAFEVANPTLALNLNTNNGPYTLTAWANVANCNSGTRMAVLSKYQNISTPGNRLYALQTSANTGFWRISNDPTAFNANASGPNEFTADGPCVANAWSYLAGRVFSTTAPTPNAAGAARVNLFVNGALSSSAPTTGSVAGSEIGNVSKVFIGRLDSTGGRFLNGGIDEITVSNAARSAEWIKLNYKLQKAGSTPILDLAYATSAPVYLQGQAITANTASVVGTASRYSVSPALPTGLTLDGATGTISGTPSVAATASAYTVTAFADSGWSTSATLNLTVNPTAPTALTFVKDSLVLVINSALTPPDTGYVAGTSVIDSFTVTPALPAGLTLGATTGILTGTPTVLLPATNFIVTAHNASGIAKDTVSITVNDIAPVIAYGTSPAYQVGVAGDTLAPVSTGGAVLAYSITPDLTAATGLTFNTSTGKIAGTPTTASASAPYTIIASNTGGLDTAVVNIAVIVARPDIAYASPTSYTVAVPITPLSPVSTGGPITGFSIIPDLTAATGLSFNTSTGTISGTATQASAATNYTIVASGVGGTDTAVANIATSLTPVPSIAYTDSMIYSLGSAITALMPDTSGSGPIDSFTVAPTLPTGLALNKTTGAISGTPMVITPAANYTVTAHGLGGTDSEVLRLTVNDIAPVVSYGTQPAAYTAGTAITALAITSTGGTVVSYAIAPDLTAQTGLVFNTSTGAISGTPTTAIAATNYVVTATNSGGSDTANVGITVLIAAPTVSYTPSTVVDTIGKAVTHTASTTGSITSCAISPAVPGLTVNATTCAITGTPTTASAAANYTITATNSTGNGTATLNLAVLIAKPTVSYAQSTVVDTVGTAATHTATTTGTITACAISPAVPGLTVNATTCAITGTPTTASAAANYTITATNSTGTGTATLNLAVLIAKPTVAYTQSTVVDTVGTAATHTATTTGTITACAISPAVPGLTVNATTCAITGTPTTASAAANYTITATNSTGTGTATLNLAVLIAKPTVAYTPSTVVDTVGKAATHTATTTGTITACAISPAVAGLTVNATTCAITGTPTTASAAANYTITATNSTGTGTATLNLAVLIAKPTVAYTPSTVVDTVGKAATHTATTTGTITACAISPAVPGLTINATTCAITGTPTTASAAANYTITATNSTGTGTATLNLAVLIAAPTNLAYAPDSVVFKKDTAIAVWTPTVTGTVTAWTISPALPAGLVFNTTTGAITGTATVASAKASYTVTASNGTGSTTKVLRIQVTEPVAISPDAFVFRVSGQEKPYAFQLPAGSTTEKLTLSIIDAWGRTVWVKSVNPSKDKLTEVSWNGKSANGRLASAGMYIARISVVNAGATTHYVRRSVTLKPR